MKEYTLIDLEDLSDIEESAVALPIGGGACPGAACGGACGGAACGGLCAGFFCGGVC